MLQMLGKWFDVSICITFVICKWGIMRTLKLPCTKCRRLDFFFFFFCTGVALTEPKWQLHNYEPEELLMGLGPMTASKNKTKQKSKKQTNKTKQNPANQGMQSLSKLCQVMPEGTGWQRKTNCYSLSAPYRREADLSLILELGFSMPGKRSTMVQKLE